MLTDLKIERFRGLSELCLKDTGRINLIVGRNDSGKTSVLEAIRLLMTGNPANLRRPARMRLLTAPLFQVYRLAFYGGGIDKPINISGAFGERVFQANVEIRSVQNKEPLSIDFESEEDAAENSETLLQAGHELVVEVIENLGAVATVRQSLSGSTGATRQVSGGAFPNMPPNIWVGTSRVWGEPLASHYSRLYRQGGEDILNAILREIEPRFESLVVLMDSNPTNHFYTTLEANIGLSQPLPLDSMGEGFSSIIAMLSAIGVAKGGLCLIDELENGVHYTIQEKLWGAVARASEMYDTQVWATTHSHDCIAAAYEALADTPDLLRVHRLERKEEGVVAVHTFDHAMLGRALERGLEVR